MDPNAADITEAVLPWLEAHRNDRFFLYLHSLDLHYPYVARPPFDSRLVSADSEGLDRDRELYDAELAYNDREIGKLVERLKALGLYEDTAILVPPTTARSSASTAPRGTGRRSTSRRSISR